jgi:hypothetical protein
MQSQCLSCPGLTANNLDLLSEVPSWARFLLRHFNKNDYASGAHRLFSFGSMGI